MGSKIDIRIVHINWIISGGRSRSKCFICLFNMKHGRTKSETHINQTSDKSCNFPLVGLPPLTPHLPSLSSSAHLQPIPCNQHVFSSAQLHTARLFIAMWDVPADSPVVILPVPDFPSFVCPLVNHSLVFEPPQQWGLPDPCQIACLYWLCSSEHFACPDHWRYIKMDKVIVVSPSCLQKPILTLELVLRSAWVGG